MLGDSENSVENMCKTGHMTRTDQRKALMSFLYGLSATKID